MANPERDAAHQVYQPEYFSAERSIPDTVPTVSTDGLDCEGRNLMLFTRTLLVGATSAAYVIYMYDGNRWIALEDSTLLAVEEYDPAATNFAQQYNIAGFQRVKVVLTALVGGNVQVTTNLTV
jgi:hypothetical protein